MTESQVSTAIATVAPNDLQSRPDKAKAPAPKVQGKLKRALDLMIFGDEAGNTYGFLEASRSVNYPVPSMRRALERQHVQRYLREQKQVFRASVSGANILHLQKIRDQTDNRMAQLGAIKLLEDDGSQKRGPSVQVNVITPGVMVDLTAKSPAPLIEDQTIIELNPLEDNEAVGHE
jgi:hypothetical protein